MDEGQERSLSPDKETQIIDDDDDSPTDDQDLWLTERNDVTTDHTGQVGLGRYP